MRSVTMQKPTITYIEKMTIVKVSDSEGLEKRSGRDSLKGIVKGFRTFASNG